MTVNQDSADLWHGELGRADATYPYHQSLLDEAELAHAEKLSNPVLRQRYVEVHGRLRCVLSYYLDQSPDQVNIKPAGHGKPYLADYPELAFNLSHTADSLVIAVARDCRLGVDIELCKPRSNLPQLVGKCFAEDEAAYWQALPEGQKTQAFYSFWTKKEAFVKATGRGIALGLNQCVIAPGDQSGFSSLPAGYGAPAVWQILAIQLPTMPSLCGAVVLDKTVAGLNLRDFANPATVEQQATNTH